MRPIIRLSPDLADVVDEAVSALAADRDIYVRDRALVHVTHVTLAEAEVSPEVTPGRRELVAGTPHVHEMALATLRERLTRVAQFQRFDGRSRRYVRAIPTHHVVTAVQARRTWPGLPELVGIAETPFVRVDGTVCQEPGYDPNSHYIYEPSATFGQIAESPTQEDAQRAYAYVRDTIYRDFPFVNEGHRAVPIAAAMTILNRPAIRGAVPGFLYDANVRGAGKTLLIDTAALIATGRPMPRKTYPRTEEELEKILGAYALRGAAFFALDNVDREFGGGCLDAVLTAVDTVDLRILGESRIPTLAWRAVIFATGNNLTLFGDTSDRVLLARLESDLENPRTRGGLPDLYEIITRERPRLVVALLSILRAYYAAGCPDMGCPSWGSFDAWARLIPHAIVFAGGASPMAARILDETTTSDDLRSLACVLDGWPLLVSYLAQQEMTRWRSAREGARRQSKLLPPAPLPRRGATSAEAIEALYDGLAPLPELRAAIEALSCPRRTSGEVRPTARALGGVLRRYKSRVLRGRRLCSADNRDKVAVWRVEPASCAGPAEYGRPAGSAGSEGSLSPDARKVSVPDTCDSSRRAAETAPADPADPARGRPRRSAAE